MDSAIHNFQTRPEPALPAVSDVEPSGAEGWYAKNLARHNPHRLHPPPERPPGHRSQKTLTFRRSLPAFPSLNSVFRPSPLHVIGVRFVSVVYPLIPALTP